MNCLPHFLTFSSCYPSFSSLSYPTNSSVASAFLWSPLVSSHVFSASSSHLVPLSTLWLAIVLPSLYLLYIAIRVPCVSSCFSESLAVLLLTLCCSSLEHAYILFDAVICTVFICLTAFVKPSHPLLLTLKFGTVALIRIHLANMGLTLFFLLLSVNLGSL